VIDVRRDDGATPRNLRPHKFRCYLFWNRRTKRIAGVLLTEIVSVVVAAVGCGTAVSDRGYRRRIRVAKATDARRKAPAES